MKRGLKMICQRCGFCCINLDVMVVNPRSIRPDGTIDSSDPGTMINKQGGRKCPHLAYIGDVAVCTIHDLSCYRGTPCDRFDQIGPQDGFCVLAAYFKSSPSAEL
ncbi:hypothetical protein [Methanocrinis sp.]|uniref:hypothetical protein n=1 Tax=Methanocrinis sp. TaxID=3101522 RepID=UPI003D148E13